MKAIAAALLMFPFYTIVYVTESGAGSETGVDRANAKKMSTVLTNYSAGDTHYVYGTLSTALDLTRDGSASSWVMFRNEPGQVCSVATSSPLDATGADYVHVRGIKFRNINGGSSYAHSHYVKIDSCSFYGQDVAGGYYQLRIDSIWYGQIYDNFFDREAPETLTVPREGDGLRFVHNSCYNTAERNTFTRVSHATIGLDCDDYGHESYVGNKYNAIRDNVAYWNHTGPGQSFRSQYNLFEGNKTYWNGHALASGGGTFQFSGHHTIHRYNIGYNDSAQNTPIGSPRRQTSFLTMGSSNNNLHEFRNTRTYNNTFWGYHKNTVTCYAVMFQDDAYEDTDDDFSDNDFKNNIIGGADTAQITINTGDMYTTAFDWVWKNNIIYHPLTPAEEFVVYFYDWDWTSKTIAQMQSTFSSWTGNFNASPLFEDSLSRGHYRDFTLSASSPAVDAGTALTTVTSGSHDGRYEIDSIDRDADLIIPRSGSNIPVADALWFWFPEANMTWERGDSILVRNDSVYILATWSAASQAYRNRFNGSYPDIGAMEYYAQGGHLDFTITQINNLLKRVNDSLAAHYQKKDMNIGFTYHDLRDSMVACTVWDVDKDGDLDPELQNGINMAEAHSWGFVVNVEGGKYSMTNGITIEGTMRWKYLHGNRTRLVWPAGFTGDMFTVAPDGEATSNNHDLNNFRMEGFVCETNEWPYSQDCNGLVINPLTNGDVVHSVFSDLEFMGCKVGILIQADSVNCGAGEHDWVNGNHFKDIVIVCPDTPMVVRSKPAPTHVGRNTFSNIAVQTAEAAGGGLARYGFYFDGGFGNRMAWCDMWDNQALTTKIPPLVFKGNARDNLFFGGSLEAVSSGAGQVIDEGVNNMVFGFQVQPDSTGPKWLRMRVAETVGGAKLAGMGTFSGTNERLAIYIPGAASTDIYTAAPSQDAAPSANDRLSCYAKTDSLIVWRAASGTNNLTFNWLRMTK